LKSDYRAFNYLKENFSNAPSLDMSAPSLSMLVRLMVAQVQECVFERITITTQDTKFTSQLQLAQEAAHVSDVYSLVHQTMTQPLMKDYVPFSWASMVQVKSEHFPSSDGEECEEEAEKTFLRFYVNIASGQTVSEILQDPEKRRKLGESIFQEAALRRMCSVKHTNTHWRNTWSWTEKTTLMKQQKPQRYKGPLSVFGARARWGPTRVICLQKRESGMGLTLRGDSPVLVAGVVPGGCAEVERKAGMLSHCSDKENARQRLLGGAKGQSSASLLNWNRKKKRDGSGVAKKLGSTFSLSFGNIRDTEAMY
ncbi:hypothetical protein GOODEAATRI_025102, partial [Goodea atripinnis]